MPTIDAVPKLRQQWMACRRTCERCAHECRDLDAIENRGDAGADVRFGTDRVDAGVGTAAAGQFLDAFVDIFLPKIERRRA